VVLKGWDTHHGGWKESTAEAPGLETLPPPPNGPNKSLRKRQERGEGRKGEVLRETRVHLHFANGEGEMLLLRYRGKSKCRRRPVKEALGKRRAPYSQIGGSARGKGSAAYKVLTRHLAGGLNTGQEGGGKGKRPWKKVEGMEGGRREVESGKQREGE